MSRGSKHLLLERDFVSAALPFCARSPSVAQRQYGHVLPGEDVGHGPRREALLDFIWLSVSWCEFLSRFLCSRTLCERITELHLVLKGIGTKDGGRREVKIKQGIKARGTKDAIACWWGRMNYKSASEGKVLKVKAK